MDNNCGRRFGSVLLGLLLLALPCWATILVYDNDAELAAQSDAVVLGKVSAVVPEYTPETNSVRTRVSVAVQAVVAGRLQQESIELSEFGGAVPGLQEEVFGTPEYRVGERVLVFVQRGDQGRFRTTGLAMGKFTVEATGGGTWVARRNYRGASVLRPRAHRVDPAPRAEERPLRDLIAEAQEVFAARGEIPAQVELPPPEDTELDYSAPFSLLGNGRWFEADWGEPVSFWIDRRGLQALGPAATEDVVRAAMAAWSDVPGSLLVLQVAGSIEPQPFAPCDGPTRIVFDDPFGELANPMNCRGILAVGGYCTKSATMWHSGMVFSAIDLGKIVFNDGFEGCGIWTACNAAEVATHELGHTIGLGHSVDQHATMSPYANFDGRCAALTQDDIDGLLFLYGEPLPDVVLPPRAPVTLRIPAGETAASKEVALQIRNPDRLPANATMEARLVVTDGTCPKGTVQAVDTDAKAAGFQDTVVLRSRQTLTARVLLAANRDNVTTPSGRSAQRCALEATVMPTASGGQDRTPRNNSATLVVDLRDDNDATAVRTQAVAETALVPLSPLRIVLPKDMQFVMRSVRVRVRNLDQGTTAPRSVSVSVDASDCPVGTVAGWDLVPDVPGDQSTAPIAPGKTLLGELLLAPSPSTIATPNQRSPFRCTLWIEASAAEGESNLSDNRIPLILDLVDAGDAR
ncbi:MAG: matrixin family metalloprotease [Candidatus Binatia bacterium]|nr:matrixin family metalloprotease [Candidatus Binatia bacterium]